MKDLLKKYRRGILASASIFTGGFQFLDTLGIDPDMILSVLASGNYAAALPYLAIAAALYIRGGAKDDMTEAEVRQLRKEMNEYWEQRNGDQK